MLRLLFNDHGHAGFFNRLPQNLSGARERRCSVWYSMARRLRHGAKPSGYNRRPIRLCVEELESRMVLAAALPASMKTALVAPALNPAAQTTMPPLGASGTTSPQADPQSSQAS